MWFLALPSLHLSTFFENVFNTFLFAFTTLIDHGCNINELCVLYHIWVDCFTCSVVVKLYCEITEEALQQREREREIKSTSQDFI